MAKRSNVKFQNKLYTILFILLMIPLTLLVVFNGFSIPRAAQRSPSTACSAYSYASEFPVIAAGTGSLALDGSNNIYVTAADGGPVTFDYKVHKYNPTGSLIIAYGSGTTLGVGPNGISTKPDGSLLWLGAIGTNLGTNDAIIRKITPPTGPYWSNTTEGDGLGQFNAPYDVVYEPVANLIYATDTKFSFPVENVHHRIQVGNADTGVLSDYWGTYPAVALNPGDYEMAFPNSLAIDKTRNAVYVMDQNGDALYPFTHNHRVLKYTLDGTFVTKWPTDGTAGSTTGKFNAALGINVDADGNVYVADTGNDRIQKFSSTGTFITSTFSGTTFTRPKDVVVNSLGEVFVLDDMTAPTNDRVVKFTCSGPVPSPSGLYCSQTADCPRTILNDPCHYYICSKLQHQCIQKNKTNGIACFLETTGNGTCQNGVCVPT